MPGAQNGDFKTLICVEGAIGVGKSTLISELRKRSAPGLVTLQEPVEEWKSVDVGKGKSMLAGMYDGSLSSGVFQLSIMQARFGPLVRALCDPATTTVISERGPFSEKIVFAKSNLSEQDFACYNYAHSSLIRDFFPIVPSKLRVVFLHLELPSAEIVERIRSRGREEEKQISTEYLARLEQAHDELKATMTTPEALGCAGTIESPVKHVVVRADRPAAELAGVVLELLSAADF